MSVANQEHVDVFKDGTNALLLWRQKHPDIQLDLSSVVLSGALLFRAPLAGVNLSQAILAGAHIAEARLTGANLTKYSQSQVCSEFDSKHETRYTGSGR